MKPRSTHTTSFCTTILQKHRHGSEENISEINNELNHIANKLSIGNRIECMKKTRSFYFSQRSQGKFSEQPKKPAHQPSKKRFRKN